MAERVKVGIGVRRLRPDKLGPAATLKRRAKAPVPTPSFGENKFLYEILAHSHWCDPREL